MAGDACCLQPQQTSLSAENRSCVPLLMHVHKRMLSSVDLGLQASARPNHHDVSQAQAILLQIGKEHSMTYRIP